MLLEERGGGDEVEECKANAQSKSPICQMRRLGSADEWFKKEKPSYQERMSKMIQQQRAERHQPTRAHTHTGGEDTEGKR